MSDERNLPVHVLPSCQEFWEPRWNSEICFCLCPALVLTAAFKPAELPLCVAGHRKLMRTRRLHLGGAEARLSCCSTSHASFHTSLAFRSSYIRDLHRLLNVHVLYTLSLAQFKGAIHVSKCMHRVTGVSLKAKLPEAWWLWAEIIWERRVCPLPLHKSLTFRSIYLEKPLSLNTSHSTNTHLPSTTQALLSGAPCSPQPCWIPTPRRTLHSLTPRRSTAHSSSSLHYSSQSHWLRKYTMKLQTN